MKLKIKGIVYLKYIYICICIFFGVQDVFAKVINLTENDNIREIIELGKPGDVFNLKKGYYYTDSTIHVPSGVIISGSAFPNQTHISSAFFMDEIFVFDVTNTTDVTIRNITIDLSRLGYGIATNANISSVIKNIKIEQVFILGDQQNESNTAISLINATDVKISNVHIYDTVGGIYVRNSKQVFIVDSSLTQVNFGNIVVSGSDIIINNNVIHSSGIGIQSAFPEGDAITIEKDSSNIEISNNVLDNGYCYMIWVHPGVNNISIIGNQINYSITHGVYIEGANQVDISSNDFFMNLGAGVAVSESSNVTITNNNLYNNSILADIYTSNIIVENNIFNAMTRDDINNPVSNLVLENNNEINYISVEADPPSLLVIGGDSELIHSGDITVAQKNDLVSLTYTVINEGQVPIKFTGASIVTLAPNIILGDPIYTNPLNSSKYGGLMITSKMQPNKRGLSPSHSIKFSLKPNLLSNECGEVCDVFVNIQTNNIKYTPFYFIIHLIN